MKGHENDRRKERTISLKLSDEDARRLCIKAGKVGISVTELLENFIQDLTFSKRSNGSDEEDLANQWLNRCMFGGLSDRNFLMFVMAEENQDQMTELWTVLQETKKRLAIGLSDFCDQEEMDAAKEDVEYWQESLEDFYQQFEKYGGGKGNGMEEDFKELVRWKQDFDAFMRGGSS